MPGNDGQNYIIKIVLDEKPLSDGISGVKDDIKKLGDQAKDTGKDIGKGLGDGLNNAGNEGKKAQGTFSKIFSGIKSGITGLLPSFTSLGKEAGKAAKPMSMAMAALLGGVGGAVADVALKAVGSGLAFIKNTMGGILEESIKNETALNRLNVALANTGKYSADNSNLLFEMSESMSDVSLHGGDDILNAMAKIQSLGNLSVSQLGKATQAAIDLAAGTGMAFDAAAGVIAKAANGNVSALGKMGIQIDTTKSKAGQFEEALDKIGKKFAGAGLGQTLDFSGTTKKLNDQIGDFQKNIGDLITKNPAVLAAIQTLAQLFNDLAKGVKSNNTVLNSFVTGAVSTFVKVFAGVIDMTINTIQKFNELKMGVKALATFFVQGLDGMVTGIRNLWNWNDKIARDSINKEFKERLESRSKYLSDNFDSMTKENADLEKHYGISEKIRNNYAENLKNQTNKTNSELKAINDNARANELSSEEEKLKTMSEDEAAYNAWKGSQLQAFHQALVEAKGAEYALEVESNIQKLGEAKKYSDAVLAIKKAEREAEMANILAFTKWEKLNWKQRLSNTTSVLGDLSALQNSQYVESFKIGQAAAAANAAISTAQGAINAYTSLAGIPVVGPALGIAAAAALVAYGYEQQQQIWSQKPPVAKAHNGGLVGGNVPFAGDMGLVRVERLERIITPEQNQGFEELMFGSTNLISTLSRMNAFLEGNSGQVASTGDIYMDGEKVSDSLESVNKRRLK